MRLKMRLNIRLNLRLKALAAASAVLIGALSVSAPAARSQGFDALAGFLGGGGAPISLSPRLFGEPVPLRVWVRPSAGPEGWLKVEGRAQVPQIRSHVERGLKQELTRKTRGALIIDGVRLTRASANSRAFHLTGEIRHAARPGAPLAASPFEARIPYSVTPQGLKLRPEGRVRQAPPALEAAVAEMLQPLDLVAEAGLEGARLERFSPSVSASGELEARADFLASPQAMANFWALALGGLGR